MYEPKSDPSQHENNYLSEVMTLLSLWISSWLVNKLKPFSAAPCFLNPHFLLPFFLLLLPNLLLLSYFKLLFQGMIRVHMMHLAAKLPIRLVPQFMSLRANTSIFLSFLWKLSNAQATSFMICPTKPWQSNVEHLAHIYQIIWGGLLQEIESF